MKLKYQIILFTVIILGCSFGISNEVVYKAESKSDVTLTTQSIVQGDYLFKFKSSPTDFIAVPLTIN